MADRLLDRDVEERADRFTYASILAMVSVGILGALVADEPVGLQLNETGFVTRIPGWLAVIIYPALGYFVRRVTQGSPTPFVRWLGRSVVLFLVIFEIAAFAAAS